MPLTVRRRALAAAASLLVGTAASAQTPTHAYSLNGSFADFFGGPSLVGLGGSIGPTGYTFGAGQGLSLSNALDANVYSIEMAFSFSQTSSYRKIVDFKALGSDNGFYNLSTAADFYPVGGALGPSGAFADGVEKHVVITRDASNLFTAYVNGASQFSFTDASGLATFTSASNIAYLLVDDTHTSGNEASGGFLDYVRIYDTALSAQQVAARYAAGDAPLTTATPEPATLALLATGLGVVGFAARRRRAFAGRTRPNDPSLRTVGGT